MNRQDTTRTTNHEDAVELGRDEARRNPAPICRRDARRAKALRVKAGVKAGAPIPSYHMY